VGLEGAKLVTSEDTLRRMGRGGQHFLAGSVADAEVSNTAELAQKLDQLQPFIAAFPPISQWVRDHGFLWEFPAGIHGPACIFWANR
jgi:hypothetical protein